MRFYSKDGPIPDSNFDNEVRVKKDPDECYSPQFVAQQKRRLRYLKKLQKMLRDKSGQKDSN